MYEQQIFRASPPLLRGFLVHSSESDGAPVACPRPEARLARLSSESNHEAHLHRRLENAVEHHPTISRKRSSWNFESHERLGRDWDFHQKTGPARTHIFEQRESLYARRPVLALYGDAGRKLDTK